MSSRNLKIIHVISSLDTGGAEKILTNILITTNNQFTHKVLCLKKPGILKNFLQENNIEVISYNLKPNFFSFSNFVKFYCIFKFFKKEKPDIMQSWLYHSDFIGGIFAKLAGCKKIIWGIYGYNLSFQLNGIKTKILIKLNSYLSHFIPDIIISNSTASAQMHKNTGYKKNIFEIITVGFPMIAITPSKLDNEKKIYPLNNSQDRIIGCLTRWDPHKGVENLLNAIKIVQEKKTNCVFYLAGNKIDYNNKHLIKKINNLKINDKNLKLFGLINNSNLFFKSLNLHIIPSKGESFPLVLGESMFNGVPCISTDVGDCKEVIGDSGWIVPHSQPVLLANMIIKAVDKMDDISYWDRKIKLCKERIKMKYSFDKMIESYKDVWHQ